jgi:aryl-alcohol dehydrogenase-like predicted oxidoreductase
VLRHPAVTSPIIGATKPHHLDDAIAALSVTLTDADMERLRKLYKPKPVLDHQ